jgi:outer membrane immunogenic protein
MLQLFDEEAMLKRLLVTAVAMGIAGVASAADVEIAPEIPARPAFSWTGCYIGGFAGGAWVNTPRSAETSNYVYTSSPYNNYAYEFDNGFMGGGTLGCNWQPVGTPWVLGVEGEAGYLTKIDGTLNSTTFANSAENGNGYGMLTARLGYALVGTLFYLKGGAAYIDESFTIARPTSTAAQLPAYVSTTSQIKGQWTIGGGFELSIFGNLILKAEYMFIGVENDSPCVVVASASGSIVPGTYCPGVHVNGISIGKVGLNYLFNGWPTFPW